MLRTELWKNRYGYFFQKKSSPLYPCQITESDLINLKENSPELGANIQFSAASNKEIRQEANNKQKGFQFKLSLPVVIDTTDRLFSLNNEKTQGVV